MIGEMVDIYLTENLGSLTKVEIPLFKNIPNEFYYDKNLELQFEFDQHNYVWVNPYLWIFIGDMFSLEDDEISLHIRDWLMKNLEIKYKFEVQSNYTNNTFWNNIQKTLWEN